MGLRSQIVTIQTETKIFEFSIEVRDIKGLLQLLACFLDRLNLADGIEQSQVSFKVTCNITRQTTSRATSSKLLQANQLQARRPIAEDNDLIRDFRDSPIRDHRWWYPDIKVHAQLWQRHQKSSAHGPILVEQRA